MQSKLSSAQWWPFCLGLKVFSSNQTTCGFADVLKTDSLPSGARWAHENSQTKAPARTWWRHQMETFSMLLALCVGSSTVPGEFPPAKRPVTRSCDVFFICPWTNGWVNTRDGGDLRRHRAHYGITVMFWYRRFISNYDYTHTHQKNYYHNGYGDNTIVIKAKIIKILTMIVKRIWQ